MAPGLLDSALSTRQRHVAAWGIGMPDHQTVGGFLGDRRATVVNDRREPGSPSAGRGESMPPFLESAAVRAQRPPHSAGPALHQRPLRSRPTAASGGSPSLESRAPPGGGPGGRHPRGLPSRVRSLGVPRTARLGGHRRFRTGRLRRAAPLRLLPEGGGVPESEARPPEPPPPAPAAPRAVGVGGGARPGGGSFPHRPAHSKAAP